MREEADLREDWSKIPGIIGCVDSTYIIIDPPQENKDCYIDQKGDVSLIDQAVCNSKKKFIDCFIGFPSNFHNSRVFHNSLLYDKLHQLPVGFRILSYSAYPCLIQALVPYCDNGHLTPAHHHFNYTLSSQRIDIEHTFGFWKQG